MSSSQNPTCEECAVAVGGDGIVVLVFEVSARRKVVRAVRAACRLGCARRICSRERGGMLLRVGAIAREDMLPALESLIAGADWERDAVPRVVSLVACISVMARRSERLGAAPGMARAVVPDPPSSTTRSSLPPGTNEPASSFSKAGGTRGA